MAWIFPVFFGVVALCVVIYAGMALRERMKPVEEIPCRLELRMREKFPVQTLIGRRDKVDYTLTFCTDEGEKITVSVTKAVYRSIPRETAGVLRHQGSRFLSFRFQDQLIKP